MTEQNKSNEEKIGFFAGSLMTIIALIILTALIVGLVTITRAWEKTDLIYNHKQGSFRVVKETWWGFSEKETNYTHRPSGWNYKDKDGKWFPMVDIEETAIDIKDAAKQPGKKVTYQSGMETGAE